MSSVNLRFINVSFSYSTVTENIVSSLSVHFGTGWTGIVGPNGAGKSTIAKLAAGILLPTKGVITGRGPDDRIDYCEQGTESTPAHSENFLYSSCNRSGNLRSILSLKDDWLFRWNTLSFGERKRFQTGVSLWRNPDLLVLDEPTNHLDHEAKELVLASLKTYSGTGIVISHDRELLDSLCKKILFVRPGSAVIRPGGITAGLEQEMAEDIKREREYLNSMEEFRRVKDSFNAIKRREESRKGSLSKSKVDRNDHDRKSKIDLARLSGKDKTSSRKVRLIENRADSLKLDAESKYFRKRKIDGFTLKGEMFRGDRIVEIPGGVIKVGDSGLLDVPEIVLSADKRVGITGNNGTGKSTLLRFIRTLIRLPEEKVLFIDQEISRKEWMELDNELKRLSGKEKGDLFSVVHRLGSEPERILGSDMLSPGEMRKVLLGLGLLKNPNIILMDEPTNHMDLPSIQCIEDALSGFEGALLLVSHDRVFLDTLTNEEWHVSSADSEQNVYRMRIVDRGL